MKKILHPILVYILVAILAISIYVYKTLSYLTDMDLSQMYIFAKTSYELSKSQNKNFDLLILGLNPRDDWLEKSYDTDTIIVSYLDESNNKIKMIPLYRDIWQPVLGCKINAIYENSLEAMDPSSYITSNFEYVIGRQVKNYLIIETEDIEKLVELIGGVDIYLEKEFVDDSYPNPNYITKIEKNPYITISFNAGWNHIDASNVAYFIRSRKNAQTAQEGGTDTGRADRQQQLIKAIFVKITDNISQRNIDMLKKLYQFWKNDIQKNFSDEQLFAILLNMKNNISHLEFESFDLPIGLKQGQGAIYHPETFISKAWVFLPSSGMEDFSSVHSFIQDKLYTSN